MIEHSIIFLQTRISKIQSLLRCVIIKNNRGDKMKPLATLDLDKKEVFIFDMDGTLIDSIGIWNYVDQKSIQKYGDKLVSLEEVQEERDQFLLKNRHGEIYFDYCKYLIEKYHLKINAEELMHFRKIASSELLQEELTYKEKAPELLNHLQQKRYSIALATSTTQHQLEIYATKNKRMQQALSFYETFDYILRKEDVKKKKPDPEIYLKVLDHYQVSPEGCLVFEDSLQGILAAKNAGIETVNVYDKYSDKDRDTLEELTDYKIDSYQEFIDYLEPRNQCKRYIKK